jgi:hypothetical protein
VFGYYFLYLCIFNLNFMSSSRKSFLILLFGVIAGLFIIFHTFFLPPQRVNVAAAEQKECKCGDNEGTHNITRTTTADSVEKCCQDCNVKFVIFDGSSRVCTAIPGGEPTQPSQPTEPTQSTGGIKTMIFKGSDPCTYWKSVFDFGMAAAGILTAAVVMVGGLYYIISFGQQDKLQRAKDVMTGALTGLILALTSWGLFNVLAPTLLKCELKIEKIALETPTTPTTGPSSGDPCAGVPEEKLFDTEQDCKTKGGPDGSACEGACVQGKAPEEISQTCTADADCPEGQKCIDGSCKTSTESTPTTFDGLRWFFDKAQAVSPETTDPDVSAPAGEEQTEQEQTQQEEAERAGKWCCVGSGTCSDVIVRGIDVAKKNDKEGLENGGLIKRISCHWCYQDGGSSDPPGVGSACEGQQDPVPINPNICRLLIALKDAGFNPSARCIICGHSRCAGAWYAATGTGTCKPPQCGENQPSGHWNGNGLDLNPDKEMQKYIVQNLMSTFGITSVIGPAGWDVSQIPGGSCPCRSNRPECHQRIKSDFNVYKGNPGHRYAAYTLCGHRSHIHLSF